MMCKLFNSLCEAGSTFTYLYLPVQLRQLNLYDVRHILFELRDGDNLRYRQIACHGTVT